MKRYVIGLDFGTLSARGVLLDAADGTLISEATAPYAHGVMDVALPDGTALPLGFALQHPEDYFDALDRVMSALAAAVQGARVIGIGLDTTTSTCTPLDAKGMPLCFSHPAEPLAYTALWKHHGAARQAAELEAVARQRQEPWLGYYGDTINLEGCWPKLLELYDEAPALYAAADTYIELTDLLTYHLTGRLSRSEMVLALKAYRCRGQLPNAAYLEAVRPGFSSALHKLRGPVVPASQIAGFLRPELAGKWDLSEGIPVAAGILDAHAGIPCMGRPGPGVCFAAVGTSACFMCLGQALRPVPDITGAFEGSIIPGFAMYEAGQSCAGDGFAWFERQLTPPYILDEARAKQMSPQAYLTLLAERLAPGESGLIALDWWNGNRSILNNAELTGLIMGLTLRTRPEEIYRAFLESAVFGARAIIENYQRHGVPVRRIVLGGGIPRKNALLCQLYADILHLEASVPLCTEQTATGSALSAAVAAGCYPDLQAAAEAMVHGGGRVYRPIPAHEAVYDRLYAIYQDLSAAYGSRTVNAMAALRGLKQNIPSSVT